MKSSILALMCLLLVGCATPAPERARADVLKVVDRSGAVADLDALLAQALDQGTAVQVALLANPRVEALLASVAVGEAERVQALRPRNPVLELERLSGESGLTLMQPLLDLLQTRSRSKRADATFAVHQNAVAHDLVALVMDVRHAWVDAVAAGQREFQMENAFNAVDAALDFRTALHAAGNVTALALARERAAHAQASTRLAAARVANTAARERLRVALGLAADDTRLTLPFRLPIPSADWVAPADAEARAIANNRTLAASRERVRARAAEAGIADSSLWLTTLEVGVTAERSAGDTHIGPVIELSLPVFDTGSARRLAAHARLEQAAHEHAARLLALQAQVRTQLAVLSATHARVRTHVDQALPAQAELMDETLKHYNAMQVGVFDLLEARHAQAETWHDFIDTLAEFWHAHIELEALTW